MLFIGAPDVIAVAKSGPAHPLRDERGVETKRLSELAQTLSSVWRQSMGERPRVRGKVVG